MSNSLHIKVGGRNLKSRTSVSYVMCVRKHVCLCTLECCPLFSYKMNEGNDVGVNTDIHCIYFNFTLQKGRWQAVTSEHSYSQSGSIYSGLNNILPVLLACSWKTELFCVASEQFHRRKCKHTGMLSAFFEDQKDDLISLLPFLICPRT